MTLNVAPSMAATIAASARPENERLMYFWKTGIDEGGGALQPRPRGSEKMKHVVVALLVTGASATAQDYPIMPNRDPLNSAVLAPPSFCGVNPNLGDCPRVWALYKQMSDCWHAAQSTSNKQGVYAACMLAHQR